jgi:hypothetical protein
MSDRANPGGPGYGQRPPTTELRDAAGEAARTVKQEGEALLDTAREQAEGMAEQGQRAGAAQAEGVARAVHRAAEELERDNPTLARVVRDAAGSVDGMARALRDRSPGEMWRSAESWARQRPLAFFGAAAIAGFALSRFARSSVPRHAGASHRGAWHGGGATTGTGQPMGPQLRTHVAGQPGGATGPGTGEPGPSPGGGDATGTAPLVAAAPGESVATRSSGIG